MKEILKELIKNKKNFVFIGEAGSGKSEIAINIAIALKSVTDRPVHFFDMDQTKPLFRSRDVKENLDRAGVVFHYEEQFWDAPTVVGGVSKHLSDEDKIVIMDVGGNQQGARLIGGFSKLLNRQETACYFVLNSYRPWSRDVMAIDGTLSSILRVSHIDVKNLSVISNPNMGPETTAEEALEGHLKVRDMIDEYIRIDYMCALEGLCDRLRESGQIDCPVIPIKNYLLTPWA